jgi:hypothetical protein
VVGTVEESVYMGTRLDSKQSIQMGVNRVEIVLGQPATRYAALVR